MDPYATLGLNPGATPEQAKEAFRRLAKTCHPDLHPNDKQAEDRFKEINRAYDEITNPQPQQPFQHAHSPGGGFNFGFGFDPSNGFAGRSPFDDLFGAFSHNMHSRQDIHVELRMTLEEAFEGKDVSVQVPPQQPGGTPRDISVKVPPGIEDGTRLVVQGAGQRIQPQHRAGDLHLLVRIQPHPRFTRQGLHLLTTVPVTAFDVLLGNELEVVGIDGHAMRVAIPTGFDSTRKLRLAGQGMKDQRGSRGDLLVELYIQYPVVPVSQQTVLRQIAEAAAKQNPR